MSRHICAVAVNQIVPDLKPHWPTLDPPHGLNLTLLLSRHISSDNRSELFDASRPLGRRQAPCLPRELLGTTLPLCRGKRNNNKDSESGFKRPRLPAGREGRRASRSERAAVERSEPVARSLN